MLVQPGHTELPLGGALVFDPGWMATAEADALFGDLRSKVPWSQGAITLFGRQVLEPRLTAWVGDADYTYSGRTVRAAPWSSSLAALRARVEQAAGVPFNAVLLNLYRGGSDSMGFHSDDEPELRPAPVIASVSLGARRTFVLTPKKKSQRKDARYDVPLGHGSLLVMTAGWQAHYRHAVPKEAPPERATEGAADERINLTFRHIRA